MNNVITATEYCFSVFDGTHDSPKQSEMGYPLITSKHLSINGLDIGSAYLISEFDYKSINKRSKISQWDILFSMIGTVGEVYLEKNSDVRYAVKNIGVFSCKDEDRAKWLYYYLKSPIAKKHIKRYLNGAVQKFLPLSALRAFPVLNFNRNSKPLIRLINFLDEKIIINNRINVELESMAKTLYDYWFVQFDFPDEEGKPYKSSGGKMVYNTTLKREIPDGWRTESILKNCNIIDCLHSKKPDLIWESESCYLLQLENILDNGLIDISEKYYVSQKDYIMWTSRIELKQHDIVMTNAGRIAAFAQIPNHIVCGIGRNITAIRPMSISPNYFFLSLSGIDIQKQILTSLDNGAFFKSFNVKGIKALQLLRPINKIEHKFEDTIKVIIDKRNLLVKENFELIKLRDWLLPMLMNGQVTIK